MTFGSFVLFIGHPANPAAGYFKAWGMFLLPLEEKTGMREGVLTD
jgi:hypothetical protein